MGKTGITNCLVFKGTQHTPAFFSAEHSPLPGEGPPSWRKTSALMPTLSFYQQQRVAVGPGALGAMGMCDEEELMCSLTVLLYLCSSQALGKQRKQLEFVIQTSMKLPFFSQKIEP